MEEAESVCPAVHHLVEPLQTPKLTNQQFINCAFLERPPSCVSLLFYRTALILAIGDSLRLLIFYFNIVHLCGPIRNKSLWFGIRT